MLRGIAATLRDSKKKRDINRFTEYVCRPPAAVIVHCLRSTRITPNQLTMLSMVVCLGACAAFIAWPGRWGAIAAAVILEISYILDCADGQLARARKRASPLGHLLDFLMDEIKAFLLFGAVSIRLWRASGDDLYLIAGIAGVAVIAAGVSLTSFTRRPEYGAKPPTADGQPAERKQRRGIRGRLIGAFEAAARTVIHYPQYIWLVAIFDRMDIYLWGYGAAHLLYLGYASLGILLRLGRFDPPEGQPQPRPNQEITPDGSGAS